MRINDQLGALATMSSEQLAAEWRRVHREPAPGIGDDLLRRGIAYRLQERASGGLTAEVRRRIKQLVRTLEAGKRIELEPIVAKPGTKLIREWRGKMHQVLVLDDGYLFDDRRYGSLTRIACEITGANWSGPRFFGLKVRSDAKRLRTHA